MHACINQSSAQSASCQSPGVLCLPAALRVYSYSSGVTGHGGPSSMLESMGKMRVTSLADGASHLCHV